MSESRKIILDTRDGNGGSMIYLPLDQLLQGSGATRSSTASGAGSDNQMEELPAVTVEGRNRGTR